MVSEQVRILAATSFTVLLIVVANSCLNGSISDKKNCFRLLTLISVDEIQFLVKAGVSF